MTALLQPLRIWAIIGAGLLMVGAAIAVRNRLNREVHNATPASVKHSDLVEKEGLILELTPRIGRLLNTSALNLTIPDPMSLELFAEQVEVTHLADGGHGPVTKLRSVGVERSRWEIGSQGLCDRNRLRLWAPVWDSIEFVERARFFVVNAEYTTDQPPRLQTEIGFEAVARTKSGRCVSLNARSEVQWRLSPDKPQSAAALKIVSWVTRSFEIDSIAEKMYEETLDRVLSDVQLRERLRSSRHEELILEWHAWLTAGQVENTRPNEGESDRSSAETLKKWPGQHPWFSSVSQDRHPSVSVVDIDRDGFDDLYVMDRWRKNVLLKNRQDGTYEDIAEAAGLDFEGHCTSAIFADFDNDGDADLFLGRSLEPSLFLENVAGIFVDRTESSVLVRMPALISAAAAADYNGDGLLDIYLSTYGAHLVQDQLEKSKNENHLILLE
ncbi:MAG: VCBS repeat-containing protein, partial [Planctomycetaceae bacterium]